MDKVQRPTNINGNPMFSNQNIKTTFKILHHVTWFILYSFAMDPSVLTTLKILITGESGVGKSRQVLLLLILKTFMMMNTYNTQQVKVTQAYQA